MLAPFLIYCQRCLVTLFTDKRPPFFPNDNQSDAHVPAELPPPQSLPKATCPSPHSQGTEKEEQLLHSAYCDQERQDTEPQMVFSASPWTALVFQPMCVRACVCMHVRRPESDGIFLIASTLRQRALTEPAAHPFNKTTWSANPRNHIVSYLPRTSITDLWCWAQLFTWVPGI